MLRYLLFLSLAIFLQPVFSQDTSFVKKFRKVTKEELTMDSCDFYADADAVVLFNYGDLRINVEPTKGLIYILDVHERIKIFTKKGKNYGNRKIRYITGRIKRLHDDIRGFKAYTYNLKEGRIIETKLEKSDKFINKISDYREELSFTMPNVQEGSILDIKYKIVSTNLGSLRTWYFQDMIPVKYSEFTYLVPDFFKYQVNTLGSIGMIKTEEKNRNINLRGALFSGVGQRFRQNDILPLEIEPYMSGVFGLLSRVEFNLTYIDSQCGFDVDFGSSYEKINEDLMESYYFGRRLSKGKFSKKWADEMKGKTKLEKAKLILEKIQKHVAWNKTYGITSDESGKKTYKKQIGSISDINLSLIAALKYHDIDAYPVILKTRLYGIPHPVYPKKWAFNYLVALVIIDGKEYLCDATLDTPLGLIRKESINYKGWLVDKKGRWIDLTKDASFAESAMYNVEIKNNVIYNNISVLLKNYAAFEAFKKFGDDVFQKELKKTFSDWEIEKITYDESNNGSIFKFAIELKRDVVDSNLIIIDPFIFDILKKNIFTREQRYSNIDFIYKKKKNYLFKLKIPDNYSVELPKSSKFETEDKKMNYFYFANKNDSQINLICKENNKSTVFTAIEYPTVKLFFEKTSASNSQVIVLKHK